MPITAANISAKDVIRKFSDVDGFTFDDGTALDIDEPASALLVKVLGPNEDGRITPDERVKLQDAGFTDSFILDLAGTDLEGTHALKQRQNALHRGVVPGHFGPLQWLIGQKPDPVRAQMIKKLGDIDLPDDDVAKSISKVLSDTCEPLYIRETAVHNLPRVEKCFSKVLGTFESILAQHTTDSNSALLPVVIQALSTYPEEDAEHIVPFLMKCLQLNLPTELSWKVTCTALNALSRYDYHSDDALPVIVALLEPSKKNPGAKWIKTQAACVLGRWKDPCTVKPLIDTLSSWSEHEARVSADMLVQIGQPAITMLAQLALSDQYKPSARGLAAHALARIEDPRSINSLVLIKLLKDKDASVRLQATEALADMGQKSWPVLMRVLGENTDKELIEKIRDTLQLDSQKNPDIFAANFAEYITLDSLSVPQKIKLLEALPEQTDWPSTDIANALIIELKKNLARPDPEKPVLYLIQLVRSLTAILIHASASESILLVTDALLGHLDDPAIGTAIHSSFSSHQDFLHRLLKTDLAQFYRINLVPKLMAMHRESLGDLTPGGHHKREAALGLLAELDPTFFIEEHSSDNDMTSDLVKMLDEPCDKLRRKVTEILIERRPTTSGAFTRYLSTPQDPSKPKMYPHGKAAALEVLLQISPLPNVPENFIQSLFSQLTDDRACDKLDHKNPCHLHEEPGNAFSEDPTLMASRVLRFYSEEALGFMINNANHPYLQTAFRTFLDNTKSPKLDAPFFYRHLDPATPESNPPGKKSCRVIRSDETAAAALRFLEMLGADGILALEDNWDNPANGCHLMGIASKLPPEEKRKLIIPFFAYLDSHKTDHSQAEAMRQITDSVSFDDTEFIKNMTEATTDHGPIFKSLVKAYLERVGALRETKPADKKTIKKAMDSL